MRLNRKQIDKLSDISSDIGLVFLASIVLPAVLDKFNIAMLILGIGVTLTVWYISLELKK